MNAHSLVLFYNLTADALALCPKFREVFDYCTETYHEFVPRPQTRMAQATGKEVSKKKSKKVLYVADQVITHGNEVRDITRQDTMVIDVEEVSQSSNRPKIMAVEGALMQYLIDTKLDMVWNNFLNGILFNDHLPPNPYPRLVTLCTQAGLRMRFNSESDEKLLKLILCEKPKIHNQAHFIYTVTGTNVFGHLSALTLLSKDTISKVRSVAQIFQRKSFIERKGQLQISLNLAVTDLTSLYGIMMPYLNTLHLSEFCYIRGPIGSHHESILLYTKMILEDVQSLKSQNKIIVSELSVGHTIFSIDDVIKNTDYIHTKISAAIENSQPICVQIYRSLGWRILGVKKQYCLYYIYADGAKDRQEIYFPVKPTSLYCNLFLTPNEASSHFKQVCSGSDLCDPMATSTIQPVMSSLDQQIVKELEDHRLLKVYKLLLIKSLIKQETESMPDIWRLFHCDGPILDYLKHLNIVMQNLVKYALQVSQTLNATVVKLELGFDSLSLGKMMKAYQEKLENVLTGSCSLAPKSLWDIIKRKLQMVTERTPVSKELALCMEEQTIKVLDEVNKLVEPVEAWILEDMHSTCGRVQKDLMRIHTQKDKELVTA